MATLPPLILTLSLPFSEMLGASSAMLCFAVIVIAPSSSASRIVAPLGVLSSTTPSPSSKESSEPAGGVVVFTSDDDERDAGGTSTFEKRQPSTYGKRMSPWANATSTSVSTSGIQV